jgi:hypothetical protein
MFSGAKRLLNYRVNSDLNDATVLNNQNTVKIQTGFSKENQQ